VNCPSYSATSDSDGPPEGDQPDSEVLSLFARLDKLPSGRWLTPDEFALLAGRLRHREAAYAVREIELASQRIVTLAVTWFTREAGCRELDERTQLRLQDDLYSLLRGLAMVVLHGRGERLQTGLLFWMRTIFASVYSFLTPACRARLLDALATECRNQLSPATIALLEPGLGMARDALGAA
jgi:hypothetical protein